MTFRNPLFSPLLRRAAFLLLAAALLLSSSSFGWGHDCCPSDTTGGGCADDCLLVPGAPENAPLLPEGDPEDEEGETHSSTLCNCGACESLSLLEGGAVACVPGLTDRLPSLPVRFPSSEAPSTPERPPSA